MDWYYTQGTERHGPVDEPTLRAKIATGEIARDALIWNSILPDWIPAAQIAPTPSPLPDERPAAPVAKVAIGRRRAFFSVLLVRTVLAVIFFVLPGIAMTMGRWTFDVFFFIVFALGLLALREQRGDSDGRIRVCIIVPMALMILAFSVNMILRIGGGLVFENGLPLWFVAYMQFGYLSIVIELGCAVYGLMRLKK